MAQPNVAVGALSAPSSANMRFSQPSRNVMAQSQGSRQMASPVRSSVNEHAEPAPSASGQQESEEAKGDEKRLSPEERQMIGDKIYHKIYKFEPVLAGKLTGMVLQMSESFIREVLSSDEALHRAVGS